MNLVWAVASVAGILLLSPPAIAGAPEYGRNLAENWCASCHDVSAGQRPARVRTNQAPSFSSIAQSPDFNADHLAYLLLDPHPKMAKLALSRRAINDIAAYILSLKR
jgi:mono/diheme cytochrome c family protein